MNRLIMTIVSTTIATLLIPTISLAQSIPKTFKQGISYAQARKILIDAGWQALALSSNREHFGGMNYLVNKLGYNEVETCSGTGMGFCRFVFINVNGQKLAVITVNNQLGQQPKVYGWRIESESR